jgi:hypothetical protein
VSLDGRGSGQSDSVGCEPRHCASKDTLSEPDLAHVCKCVLGWQTKAKEELSKGDDKIDEFQALNQIFLNKVKSLRKGKASKSKDK